MTIPVTTRSGKGSPLTPAEMDANLTQLARDATIVQQGNVRFSNTAETQALAATDLAISPASFLTAIGQYFANYGAGNVVNAIAGYYRLQNGPLIQWGNVTKQASTAANVAFYIPMTNVYFVGIQDSMSVPTPNAYVQRVSNLSGTGFSINADVLGSGNPVVKMYWIAIGI